MYIYTDWDVITWCVLFGNIAKTTAHFVFVGSRLLLQNIIILKENQYLTTQDTAFGWDERKEGIKFSLGGLGRYTFSSPAPTIKSSPGDYNMKFTNKLSSFSIGSPIF